MLQRVLRGRCLYSYLGCSTATFYRRFRKDPEFPKPVRLGAGMNGYLKDEVDVYLETRPRVDNQTSQDPNMEELS
ncbi:MAG: AlpA family phage regulatory protein [Candidatus Thiodiazotropha taylori]|uniref:AlpA family phage regulatory protein n=1 Tax=Candidatus Thiodiazotropha taylori TaxID=2792791 RepID=A0A9E4T844_9GAMM|nr:AlpA family phage regulatory protein [Candidatus Thiodiazotropha taylori]MCW4259255.1 AlpA family phage regulatory protein [Candidatus Thiodiazotropha taylori]